MTLERPLVLGLDIGSSRIKGVLVDRDGEAVRAAAEPSPFTAAGDRTEMTVEALVDALASVVGQLGDDRAQVAAVGIAGVAESGAPLDRRGAALAPIIAWHDRRGEDVAERVSGRLGPELASRIGQPLRYVSSVAKLGWLLENGVTGVARWLGVPELALRALTGGEATEGSLAARTGCRDVGDGTWMADVARAAGFGIGVFPAVATAGEVMGRVTSQAAAVFGLPAGIPVTIAGHDHLAGVVGSGARADDLANSVGTAETVVGRSPQLPDVAGALRRGAAVTVFPGVDGWAVLVSAARSGLVLEEAAVALGRSPADLDALADGADLLDAPDLAESLRTRQRPRLPDGAPGEVWQTLLHHLAAQTARAAVQVVGLLGRRDRLVVFGGGGGSASWLAAKAELSPLPVWRTSAPEAVARGAAVYAGVVAGWWRSPNDAPPPPLLPV